MISQRSIQEVLAIAQVEDIISEYVDLKRRGVNMIGLCPFHDEKTPSFTVSPSKNIYKCFGCGKGGGAPQFLMEHEQLSFPEAIRSLAKKYNIELEEDKRNDDEYLEEKKKLDSLHIINQYALDYFKNNLHNTQEGKSIGLSYFKERGFIEKTIQDFALGYSPKESKAFLKDALAKGYKENLLKELGLVSQGGYDFFRERIIFPIHNQSGRVIAFSGRILDNQKKTAKYINSPETELYNKRKVLYGLHLAKKAISKQDECIIVEGYSDVISLYQAGVQNVVASSGTSLTKEQIYLIKRFSSNVILLYDGDPAGIKASMRGIDLLLAQDVNTYLVTLPEGEDPDSYMRKLGYQAFIDFIKKEKKDFIIFKADFLLKEIGDDPIKKSAVIKDIISSLAKIPDHLKRDLYVKKCSEVLALDEGKLVRELDKELRSGFKKKQQELAREKSREQFREEKWIAEKKNDDGVVNVNVVESADYFQEKDLARLVIQFGDKQVNYEGSDISMAEYIYASIYEVLEMFDSAKYKQILEEGFKLAEKEQSIKNTFLTHANPEIQQFTINALAEPYTFAEWHLREVFLQTQKPPDENFLNDSIQAILRFKMRKIKRLLKDLSNKITNHEGSEEDKTILIKAYQKVQEDRKSLALKLRTVID